MINQDKTTEILDFIRKLELNTIQGFDYEFTKTYVDYQIEYFKNLNFNAIWTNDKNQYTFMLFTLDHQNKVSFFNSPIIILTSHTSNNQSLSNSLVSLYNYLIINYKPRVLVTEPINCLNKLYFNNKIIFKLETILILDLIKQESELFKDIRKSYKSLVNYGKKHFQIKILNSNSINNFEFNLFKEFHLKVSGKVTRSDLSWKLQELAIESNDAFLINTYENGGLISSTFNLYGKTSAYYGVGVYDRDLMKKNIPLAHSSIFNSILIAKQNNKEKFIVGRMYLDELNDKEKNIYTFKKGFTNDIEIKTNLIIEYNE